MMKKQVFIIAAFLMSVAVFGQKDELKEAEKALKSNDFATTLSFLDKAESLIPDDDQKSKAKFYYLKAKALYQNGADGIDVKKVGEAFRTLINYENETKAKYSTEAGEILNALIQKTAADASSLYATASETQAPGDYVKAAKKFNEVFILSPQDTSYLDNTALVYFFAKDYANAAKVYQQLLDLNYTGISTVFVATNKETGEDMTFSTKNDRDLQVKIGMAENPREEVKESRRMAIYKLYAEAYVQMKEYEKALEILAKGREEFPKDYELLIEEANVYFAMGNTEKFKSELEEAIKLNPTEPTLYYNVGVMNLDLKNVDEAISFFQKAIELDPNYGDAYNNIGAAIIEKAAPIVDEMNKNLSNFSKYDELQAQQFEIYKQAIPYYEKAHEINPEGISIIQTLIGLYENLEMTDKLMEMRDKYEALKQ